jgi:hypothetical protein
MARLAAANSGRLVSLPGLYAELLDAARAEAAEDYTNPVLAQDDYTPSWSSAERNAARNASRQRRASALKRRVAELEHGQPQIVRASQIRRRADAEGIDWLHDDYWQGNRGGAPFEVRVEADDTLSIAVTVDQQNRRTWLISKGFPRGYVDPDGDYVPVSIWDEDENRWRPIEAGDDVPEPPGGLVLLD